MYSRGCGSFGPCSTWFFTRVVTFYVFGEINFYYKKFLEISIRLRCNLFLLSGYLVFSINYFTIGSKVQILEKLSDVSRTLSPQIFRKLAKRIFVKNLVTLAFLSGYLPLFFVNNVLLTYIGFYTLFATLVLHNLYIDSIYVLEACLEKINESLMKLRENSNYRRASSTPESVSHEEERCTDQGGENSKGAIIAHRGKLLSFLTTRPAL